MTQKKLLANEIILKADTNTSFTYKIEDYDFTGKDFISINSKNDIKHIISQILSKRANIIFYSIENKIFKNNMILVDSYLHIIMAEMLLLHYLNENDLVAELVTKLSKKDPVIYGKKYTQQFYERKVKEFLYHIVMGMSPIKFGTENMILQRNS